MVAMPIYQSAAMHIHLRDVELLPPINCNIAYMVALKYWKCDTVCKQIHEVSHKFISTALKYAQSHTH